MAGAAWEAVPWGEDGAPSTIVARATPPGRGGIGVVRLSGPRVREILGALGAGRVLEAPARTAVLTPLHGPGGELLDRGLVTFFPGPRSYTGEDVAEFSVHGGPMVVASVVEACRAAGALPAEPGGFTKRAWLHGKLDRLQVEAIEELVEADSPARHRVAVEQAEGGLSRRLDRLREEVVEARALLAHHLDFPDEDDAPTPRGVLVGRLEGVGEALRTLLATSPRGRLLREGAVVVLAGAPNAGKSSLFNALVGEARALVTEHAGTTRDAVDAFIALGGYPVRIVDTAGLRDEGDAVERAGIEIAEGWIHRADAIVWCHAAPAGAPPEEVERRVVEAARLGSPGAERRLLPVRTCMDLVAEGGARPGPAWPGVEGASWIPVSSHTGQGLDRLEEALVAALFGEGARGAREAQGHVLVRERHREGVALALSEVEEAADLLRGEAPAELADLHLAEATDALLDVVGPVPDEVILDAVFRTFCIGK